MDDPAVAICVTELGIKAASLGDLQAGGNPAWDTAVEKLKQSGSADEVFAGFKVESPTSLVSIVECPSASAQHTLLSDPSLYNSLLPSSLASGGSTTTYNATLFHPDGAATTRLSSVLSAPCLEVVTFRGIESGSFPAQVGQFVTALNDAPAESIEGYRGAVYGEVVELAAAKEEEGDVVGSGKDLVLLVGWESKDAHVRAKGLEGGALATNIHLIRSGRKSVEMYHVYLKQF